MIYLLRDTKQLFINYCVFDYVVRLASVQEQRLPIVPLNNIGDPQNQRLSPDNLLQEPTHQSGAISPQSKVGKAISTHVC